MPFANKISGIPARLYHGVVPVVAGVVIAYVLTGLLWPSLRHDQTYKDIVVGSITWHDIDKDRDFHALYLTVVVAAAASLAVGATLRSLSEAGASGEIGQALNAVLAFTMLPACWRFGRALMIPGQGFEPLESLILILGFLLVCLGLFRFRRELTGPVTMQIAGGSLVAIVLGYLSGLAVALFAGRMFLTSGIALAGKAEWLGGLGALAASLGIIKAFARSADAAGLSRRLEAVLLLAQVPLPLLLFIMLPPPWLEAGKVSSAPYSIALPVTLGTLVLLSWTSLGLRSRAWGRRDVSRSRGLGEVLDPSCLAAVAAFLMIPSIGLPTLSGDLFHSGEQLLPWQQLVVFHKIPYVDFIPIHGLMAIIKGFFNAIFFDGTAAGFTATTPLTIGVWAIATFLSASALAGPVVALFICCLLMTFPCVYLDRVYFLMPSLFVLANARLLARPSRWLLTWPLVSVVFVAYSASLGPALVIGTLPIACLMAYRLLRDDRRAFARVLAILAAVAFTAICLPPVRGMAFGMIRYIWENYDSNNVAYGISWEQGFDVPIQGLGLTITRFGWEVLRCSWVAVVLCVGFRWWQEMAKPGEQRHPEVLALGSAGPIALLLAAQYAFGRIDPNHLTRTDVLSFVALGQLLPVALLLGRPGARSISVVMPIVLVLGIITPNGTPDSYLASLVKKTAGTSAVPSDRELVDGKSIGLPSLGRLDADPKLLGGIRELKDALSAWLKPGESYLDLTNTSAYYYYLGLPVPVLYAANYTAAAAAMQIRMLDQLHDKLPPVVLIAPASTFDGGPASLRSYRLYRESVLRYTAVRRGRFTFLVDPARVPGAPPRGSAEQCALLEPITASMLEKIPVSWGRSWKALSPRFHEVAQLGRDRLESSNDVVEREPGVFVPSGIDPFLVYGMDDLNLGGGDADFLKLTFRRVRAPGTPDPIITIRWESPGHEISPPVVFTATSSSLLVPLGANPRWLLRHKLSTLRIDLENPESCRRIALNDIKLLRLAPGR
jgi:hypothetical protein